MSRTTRLRGVRLLVGLVASAVCVAACSSSSASPPPTSSATSTASKGGTGSTVATGDTGPKSAGTGHLCGLVSSGDIQTTLNTTVRTPYPTVHGSVTTCTYLSPTHISSVSIRYDTASSPSAFASEKALFVTDGETPSIAPGLGGQAFAASANSSRGKVSSVVVLKGSTEVSVTAVAPLDQVVALTNQILPKL
jgi:hypothetical protein